MSSHGRRLHHLTTHLSHPATPTPAAGKPHTRLSSLSRDLSGKIALITGAASGQGDATARVLADEG